MDDQVAATAADQVAPSEKQKRETSRIAFPYVDLNDSIEIARVIWDKAGTSSADQAQVAAWAGHDSVDSGAFRTRMSGARLFGVITSGSKQVALTELGRDIVDDERGPKARVDAFLRVPLYGELFKRYHGGTLPSTNVALEADFVDLGVSEKQKDRARQVFQRSAEQAGFFNQGRNRLVLPAFRDVGEERPPEDKPKGGGGGGSGGADHPLIELLVSSLPEPGTIWAKAERTKWITMAEAAFDVVYEDEAASASPSGLQQPSSQSRNGAEE